MSGKIIYKDGMKLGKEIEWFKEITLHKWSKRFWNVLKNKFQITALFSAININIFKH